MHLTQLQLTNLKGFRELDFDLTRPDGSSPAGWTVFVGDNGSGKSTLLKAVALCLVGAETARALQPSFSGWLNAATHESGAGVEIRVRHTDIDDFFTDSGKKPTGPFPARLELRNGGREVTLSAATPKGTQKNYNTPGRTIWSYNAQGWFACGYGPFRRVFGESNDAMKNMVAYPTRRFVTMFQEAASLSETDQWLRDLRYRQLEKRDDASSTLSAVINLLNDGLIPNELKVDRVDSEGLWLVDRNGVQLSWREMSDGYRSAIALMCDIVRHMVDNFGIEKLVERQEEGHVQVTRTGVVLIDEVEAHLHPEWQREIGFWLKKRFPNIQFLVTTHSPLICQAADAGGLFHLPEPGSGDVPRKLSEEERIKIRNSRADTILESSAFGLPSSRSPEVVAKRSRLADLNVKKRRVAALSEAERVEVEQLRLFLNEDEEP